MFKKTAAMILIASLALSAMSAASASGMFSELAQSEDAEEWMPALAEAAEDVGASLTTPEGLTIKIGEAYYEGDRVFVSYQIGAVTDLIELYEGDPDAGIEWDQTLENWVPSAIPAFYPDVEKENSWLTGIGKRWLKAPYCEVMDGLELEDGEYADIIAGTEMRAQDGSVTGWKECVVPKESGKDTLTFLLAVSHGTAIKFQEGTTFRENYGLREKAYVSFTLNRHECDVRLQGMSAAAYSPRAEMTMGKIDMKGVVRITDPAQAASWIAWQEGEDAEGPDLIISWNLYRDGEFVSCDLYGATGVDGTEDVVFELQYPVTDNTENLALVPEYAQAGERPDEAVALVPAEASR